MRRCRVNILGASGTGQTTLGRALADAWSAPHADADDFFWVPTDPPYRLKREPEERVRLMETMFVGREAWVLSGSVMGWGEPVVAACDVLVLLTLDPAVRMARLDRRERLNRAGAIDAAAHDEFLEWARGYDDPAFDGRNRVRQEAWLAEQGAPVVRLDTSAPPADVLACLLDASPHPS